MSDYKKPNKKKIRDPGTTKDTDKIKIKINK